MGCGDRGFYHGFMATRPDARPPAPGDADAGGGPRNVVVLLLDSLNRHMLGQLRRQRVRHTEPRPFRPRAGRPFHVPCHRLAAVHAGAPRHPVRLARLPLAALGLHRGLGGADHRSTPAGGRDDHAGLGPSRTSSRSGARTTTPTSAPGTTCGGTRATPGARTRTRVPSARPRCPPVAAAGSGATAWAGRRRATGPTTARGRSSAPSRTTRAPRRCGPPPRGCVRARRMMRRSCSSWTSSTPTSRSTHPSPGPGATTRSGTVSC